MSPGEEAASLCNTGRLFLNNIAESESMQLEKASEIFKSKCLFLSLACLCNAGGQLSCRDCCVTISPGNHFWNPFFAPSPRLGHSLWLLPPQALAQVSLCTTATCRVWGKEAFEGTLNKFRFLRIKDVRTRFSPVNSRSCQLPKGAAESSAYIVGNTRGEVQGLLVVLVTVVLNPLQCSS